MAPPPPTVAIVLKGCDARSVVALLQERQIRRENLVLVGVACPGVVDARKAEIALGDHEAPGGGEDARGNIRVVVDDGTEVTLRREDVLAEACLECRAPAPAIYDVLLGESAEAKETDAERRKAAEFESKPMDVRWMRFQEGALEVHPVQCLPPGVPGVLLQGLPAGSDPAAVDRRRHGLLRRCDLPHGPGASPRGPLHGVRGLLAGMPHGNRHASLRRGNWPWKSRTFTGIGRANRRRRRRPCRPSPWTIRRSS